MTVDLRTAAVRAVAAADDGVGYFVVADGRLLSTVGRGPEAEVVCEVPCIREIRGPGYWEGRPLEVLLYVHGSWVWVAERFGENATLVNTVTGLVREHSRVLDDGYPEHSVGFVEREGRTLLIAPTAWNRLDVFDVESGELLTDREMYRRGVGDRNAPGGWEIEEENWSWLAVSSPLVSPDSRHFLCQSDNYDMPDPQVQIYTVEEFLTDWGASGAHAEGGMSGFNRSIAFIDDATFAMAMDDRVLGGFFFDEEDVAEQGYEYKQLGIFTIPSPLTRDGEKRWIDPVAVDCDVFPLDEHGEVRGELHYDKATGHLVALNANGASLVRLDGSVVEHLPETRFELGGVVEESTTGAKATVWQYSTDRRLFYRWRDGVGIEECSFSWAGALDGAQPG